MSRFSCCSRSLWLVDGAPLPRPSLIISRLGAAGCENCLSSAAKSPFLASPPPPPPSPLLLLPEAFFPLFVLLRLLPPPLLLPSKLPIPLPPAGLLLRLFLLPVLPVPCGVADKTTGVVHELCWGNRKWGVGLCLSNAVNK